MVTQMKERLPQVFIFVPTLISILVSFPRPECMLLILVLTGPDSSPDLGPGPVPGLVSGPSPVPGPGPYPGLCPDPFPYLDSDPCTGLAISF